MAAHFVFYRVHVLQTAPFPDSATDATHTKTAISQILITKNFISYCHPDVNSITNEASESGC